MSNFIKTECEECGHKFRKKCKKVCLWHEDLPANFMYEADLDGDWRKFYKDDGELVCGLPCFTQLLPKYGCGKCPSCKTRFWFKKVDEGIDSGTQ